VSASSRIRKYEWGYEKRKKKKKIQQFVQTPKGALDRFIVKEHQTPVHHR
jgi:predicted GTPase